MDTVEERCSVVVEGGCCSYQQPAGTSTCTVRPSTGGTRTGAVLCADPTVDAKQPVHDCFRICIFIGEHCGHIFERASLCVAEHACVRPAVVAKTARKSRAQTDDNGQLRYRRYPWYWLVPGTSYRTGMSTVPGTVWESTIRTSTGTVQVQLQERMKNDGTHLVSCLVPHKTTLSTTVLLVELLLARAPGSRKERLTWYYYEDGAGRTLGGSSSTSYERATRTRFFQ